MERDFKGVWIPKEIWLDEKLGLKEKYYVAIYLQYQSIKDTEQILSAIFSKSSIFNARTYLQEHKYIKIVDTPEEAKDFVLSMRGKGDNCEWCGKKCYVLHEHHFPLSKAKGGLDTVKICPNCHAVYHSIYKGG